MQKNPRKESPKNQQVRVLTHLDVTEIFIIEILVQ